MQCAVDYYVGSLRNIVQGIDYKAAGNINARGNVGYEEPTNEFFGLSSFHTGVRNYQTQNSIYVQKGRPFSPMQASNVRESPCGIRRAVVLSM